MRIGEMEGLKSANLALAFLLELCALAALGFWGFRTGQSFFMKLVLGLGLPLVVAIFWGAFLAPKAAVAVSEPLHTILELLVFALAAVLLYVSGQPGPAWIFGLAVVVNQMLLAVWQQ